MSLYPLLNEPIEPDTTPYRNVAISVSIAPLISGDNIKVALSATKRPYRVLSSGVVEMAPDTMQTTVNMGNVEDDPELAAAVSDLMALLVTR